MISSSLFSVFPRILKNLPFKRDLSLSPYLRTVKTKPLLRPPVEKKEITPFGWFLLLVPTATFGLGTWQVQRKQWKENLMKELQEKTNTLPVPLPTSLEEIEKLEYQAVKVKGKFLHDKEMFMGPRSLLVHGDAATKSSLISAKTNKSQGYLVVTPFKLSDREETILVNRGWVPSQNRNPQTRQKGQVEDEVELIGIVRLHENRPPFSLQNKEGSNIWFFRDLNKMSEVANTSKIFLDATTDLQIPEGPIGGQTRISLRNEHLSYILTWYSLCAATSYMWYLKFLKK